MRGMRHFRAILPPLAVALLAYLAIQSRVPDRLPASSLPRLDGVGELPLHASGDLAVVSLWAPWCLPCREELPALHGLAAATDMPLLGVVYRDAPDRAVRWLEFYGNPYDAVAIDEHGDRLRTLASEGIPQLLIVGGDGTIHFRHVGLIGPEIVARDVLPRLRERSQ